MKSQSVPGVVVHPNAPRAFERSFTQRLESDALREEWHRLREEYRAAVPPIEVAMGDLRMRKAWEATLPVEHRFQSLVRALRALQPDQVELAKELPDLARQTSLRREWTLTNASHTLSEFALSHGSRYPALTRMVADELSRRESLAGFVR